MIFFSDKFGLYHVDFNDPERKRTAKKSAEIYSQIIKSNKIPVELLSVEISHDAVTQLAALNSTNYFFFLDSC
jgi:hypothetical protein